MVGKIIPFIFEYDLNMEVIMRTQIENRNLEATNEVDLLLAQLGLSVDFIEAMETNWSNKWVKPLNMCVNSENTSILVVCSVCFN